jgi:RimJ/RimL family protein N-acetyltransferase
VKLVLRDVADDDLPLFYAFQSDPVAYGMAGVEPRDEPAFMEHWRLNVLGDPAVIKKTAVCDGGVAGFFLSFEREGIREVGYWLGREHWGRGIASKLLRRFLPLDPHRPLHAVVWKPNAASLRVLEKCGFVVECERPGKAGGAAPGEVLLRLDAAEE